MAAGAGGMRALGYYLNTPSVIRQKAESAALMRLGLAEYGARLRLRDHRTWPTDLAVELRHIADDLDAIGATACRRLEVAA